MEQNSDLVELGYFMSQTMDKIGSPDKDQKVDILVFSIDNIIGAKLP